MSRILEIATQLSESPRPVTAEEFAGWSLVSRAIVMKRLRDERSPPPTLPCEEE